MSQVSLISGFLIIIYVYIVILQEPAVSALLGMSSHFLARDKELEIQFTIEPGQPSFWSFAAAANKHLYIFGGGAG